MPQRNIPETNPLSPEIASIIDAAPMPGLGVGPACAATRSAIEAAMKESSLRGTLSEAALWLLAGELDRSHSISQKFDSADGAFWHGIMHRREGDFGNAKYWFRRVGQHPVHDELIAQVAAQDISWDARDFPVTSIVEPLDIACTLIDLTATVLSERTEWQADLERICWWEWQLMFA